MFQDGREAVAEALKLVEAFEAEVSLESSTAKALAEKGWGGGKSVEELWADVFAAVSFRMTFVPLFTNRFHSAQNSS
jgi:hypothetical protein